MKVLYILVALLGLSSLGFGQYIVNFEGAGETKTAYASGDVTLNGISWNMTEVLIGTDASDWKNGVRSARLRGYGTSSMTMLANKTNGAGVISFSYRRYGTDAQVDWKVEYSTNDGGLWTQAGSSFTAPSTDVVQSFSATINVAGNIRIRIKRATASGSSNRRLNIDDINITDYTGSTPTITLNPTSLSGFSYTEGSGPSSEQSFTAAGSNLTADISITPPTNYEISTGTGGSFAATNPITLTQSGGTVSSTTIYVRLKAGLVAGSYNSELITASSTDATSQTVSCSGTVNAVVNPTGFSATAGSSTDIDLAWTKNAAGNNVMVAYNTTNTFGIPTGTYVAGNPITGGGTVIYNGSATSYNHSGLTPITQYFYKAWSVNGTAYSTGVIDDETTLIPEPTNHATSFAATANSISQITVSWTDAAGGQLPSYYLVKAAASPATPTAPVDGTTEANGTLIKNIAQGVQTAVFTGLEPSTTYNFSIWPYTNSGTDIDYKTNGTVPTASTTTFEAEITLPYYQNFADCETHYWIAYNVAGVNKTWTCYETSDGYQSIDGGDDVGVSDDYLISPKINLNNYTNEVLSFETNKLGIDPGFLNLDLLYSINFSGDPTTATWTPLTANWASGLTYVNSGEVDLSGISGAEVFLAFRYRSSSVSNASKWNIDDIYMVQSAPTTVVNAPATQVPAATISSLLDTEGEKVKVFEFVIADLGADALSTIVTELVIERGSSNTANWIDHIQDIVLQDGAAEVVLEDVNISNTKIELSIESGNLVIADGASKTLSLYIYLNTSNIEDNSILSFMIDADDHGFDEHPTGSRFAPTFSSDVVSNNFTVQVTPTVFKFIQQPTNTDFGSLITPAVTLAFTDANSNLDLDASGKNISMIATGATVTGTLTKSIEANGLATFADLLFTTSANSITLTASDDDNYLGTSATVISNTFAVIDIPQLFISEIANPDDEANEKFVEIYNASASTIDFGTETIYFARQANGDNTKSIQLTGQIVASGTYIIAYNGGDFEVTYGFAPNIETDVASGSGNDSYFLYKNGDHTTGILIDAYGEKDVNGNGTPWYYDNTKAVRLRTITEPNSSWDSTEWHIPLQANTTDMTPGVHNVDVSWQGTTSTGWNTKGNNWSGTYGYIPDASFNVTITSQTNQPTISAEAATNNLTISSGVLTVGASQSLRVFGVLSNSVGTSGLVLKADATGPSSLLHNTNGIQATVESYFNDFGAGQWYLVSSPLTDGVAGVFMDQYLDYWDEPAMHWVSIEDPNTPLVPGRGYSLLKNIASIATYSGTLNNGGITVSGLTRTANNASFGDGWNLVGNPYPSVLDINLLDFGDHITASASVWPHGSSGPYLAWSQGGGGSIQARYIQPGQGFMVQLSTTNQSLTFTNAARTHHALDSFDKGNEFATTESLKITFTDASDRTDETYLSFREEATIDFDNYYDVHKLFGGATYPHIFSYIDVLSDERAAIQSIPQPEPWQAVHLGHRIGVSGSFTLKAEGIQSFAPDQAIYLVDKANQEIYSLRYDSVFQFYIDKNESSQRFDLLFDVNTGLEAEEAENTRLYFNDDVLVVQQIGEKPDFSQVKIYNILGQLVYEAAINEQYETIPTSLPTGHYLIHLTGSGANLNSIIFRK